MSDTCLSPERQWPLECPGPQPTADGCSPTAINSTISDYSIATLTIAEQEQPLHFDVVRNALVLMHAKGRGLQLFSD